MTVAIYQFGFDYVIMNNCTLLYGRDTYTEVNDSTERNVLASRYLTLV